MNTTRSDDTKAKICFLFDHVSNRDDPGRLCDLIGKDYPGHDPVPGSEGIKNTLEVLRGSFPDIRFVPEDIVAEHDLVSARYHREATHTGRFGGIPATGKKIPVKVTDFYRFSKGRPIEHRDAVDELRRIRQIGVIAG